MGRTTSKQRAFSKMRGEDTRLRKIETRSKERNENADAWRKVTSSGTHSLRAEEHEDTTQQLHEFKDTFVDLRDTFEAHKYGEIKVLRKSARETGKLRNG